MRRLFQDSAARAGLPPGSSRYFGERKGDGARLERIRWTADAHERSLVPADADSAALLRQPGVHWLNLVGMHDTARVEALGGVLGLHPLEVEDILNQRQRPRVEDHGDHLFVALRMVYCSQGTDTLVSEQVCLVLRENCVVTFQEVQEDVFDSVRERIRLGRGRIREMGADYLMHALMDAVVDNYFVVLEQVENRVDVLEQRVLRDAGSAVLAALHEVRRELIYLRKTFWPFRTVVSEIRRMEGGLIRPESDAYFRDLQDHVVQVVEAMDVLRELLGGAMEIHLSMVSNRMNETMRVLTVISTIFIPLTFVAGIYGMNFDYMPELRWRWGYALAWAGMLAVAGMMVAYFRRRRWL